MVDPSLPLNAVKPTTAFGGRACTRLFNAAITGPRLSDWSSITDTEPALDGALGPADGGPDTAFASVARMELSPTDMDAASEPRSVTSFFGGVPPSVRKPALAKSAMGSELPKYLANSRAAPPCS